MLKIIITIRTPGEKLMPTSFNDLLKRYVLFSGRASRTEFWLSSLVLSILLFATGVIDVTGITFDSDDYLGSFEAQVKSTFSNFGMIITIPVLSVTCRRLHDTNRSGWFLLLYFIPLIGLIWLLVLCCLEGTEGENRYGFDPTVSHSP